MAKRRKKSSKGKGLAGLKSFFSSALSFSFKVLPLLLVLLAFGAIFLGVREALFADAQLLVQKVSVHPSGALSPKIQAWLENQTLGKNILQLDISKISRELEKDPSIESAQVLKQLPWRINVEIEKREPAAFVRFSPKSNFGLISADGVILDIAEESQVTGLLVECFWMGIKEPAIGQKFNIPGFTRAIEFVTAYQSQPMAQFESITKVQLDHLGNVTITLGRGPQVHLGRRPMQAMPALQKIMALLQNEGRDKIDYIDLQFDNVIVKRKR